MMAAGREDTGEEDIYSRAQPAVLGHWLFLGVFLLKKK